MKSTVSLYDFRNAFPNMNRGENFTYEGLGALYDYLEQYEEDTGIEMELDVIAFCCEYSEYASVEKCAEEYGLEGDKEELLEQLQNNTCVIEIENSDGIIIQCY